MLVRQAFQSNALATSTAGLVFNASAVSPAGGVGTLPITEAPGFSATLGTAALLVVNTGIADVSCRWWLAANGAATPHLEDFKIRGGQSVAMAIPSFAPDQLVFYAPGAPASIGLIYGHVVAIVDLGPIDVVAAPVGS